MVQWSNQVLALFQASHTTRVKVLQKVSSQAVKQSAHAGGINAACATPRQGLTLLTEDGVALGPGCCMLWSETHWHCGTARWKPQSFCPPSQQASSCSGSRLKTFALLRKQPLRLLLGAPGSLQAGCLPCLSACLPCALRQLICASGSQVRCVVKEDVSNPYCPRTPFDFSHFTK
jgi:hypothetical protein